MAQGVKADGTTVNSKTEGNGGCCTYIVIMFNVMDMWIMWFFLQDLSCEVERKSRELNDMKKNYKDILWLHRNLKQQKEEVTQMVHRIVH